MASKDRGLAPIELSSFCSEIALMLGAGMPLYAGMEALEKTYEQDAHADLYHKVSETLTQTGSLRDALEETHAFPTYLVEMCGIGERTGHLEDVMQGLSAYYERESRIRQAVRSAVTYPLVLSVMMVLILMVLILKVMPVFRRVLGSMGRGDDRHRQHDDERRHGDRLGCAGAGARLCAGGAYLRTAAEKRQAGTGARRAEKGVSAAAPAEHAAGFLPRGFRAGDDAFQRFSAGAGTGDGAACSAGRRGSG